ncbi:MAG: alpha/beta fold hydrolase [Polyangiaceae bacterium]
MRFWPYITAAALLTGCDSNEAPPTPKLAPAPIPTVRPEPPPTAKQAATFESTDGAVLAADLYLAKPNAPAVVLLHRLHAQREELSPLAERLASAPKRFTVLNLDLRDHGDSKAPKQAPRVAKKPAKDTSRFDADVTAAIAYLDRTTEHKMPRVILVGSSLGAVLAARAAKHDARVTALALVSPGAAIDGLDVYQPYADVRELPTFLAAATDDNVSKAPFDSLSKMAKAGVTKQYPGPRHSAGHIAADHAELWSDLVDWLVGQFDESPSPRSAPGAEKETAIR